MESYGSLPQVFTSTEDAAGVTGMIMIKTDPSAENYEYPNDKEETSVKSQKLYRNLYHNQDDITIKTEPMSDTEDNDFTESPENLQTSNGNSPSRRNTRHIPESGDCGDSQNEMSQIKKDPGHDEEEYSNQNERETPTNNDSSLFSPNDSDSNSSQENMYLHFDQTPQINVNIDKEIVDSISAAVADKSGGNNSIASTPGKEAPKRVRNSLTIGQKREMCVYKAENPKFSNRKVKLHFEDMWGCKIGRSTIQDVLKKSARWLNMPSSKNYVRTTKASKNSEMEKILYKWILDHKMRGISLTNTKIVEKARLLGEEFNVDPEFAFSNGWLYCFKQRHGLLNTTNAATNSPVIIPSPSNFLGQIRSELNFYNLSDVYCMDELGLFYGSKPDKSLAHELLSGETQAPRVTVGLCVNANGSDKMKPLVIGKQAIPGSFGDKFNSGIYAVYRSNNNAVMTSADFSAWLKEVDNQMRKEHRRILLLIKFTMVHEAVHVNLSNIKLMYLPQSMGSSHGFHPMDMGLIWDFKCHYRMKLIQHFLNCERMGEPQEINMRSALHLIDDSWKSLSSSTVVERWVSTGILVPTNDCMETEKDDPLAELASVFYNYNVKNKMEADEYITFDNLLETSEPLVNASLYEGNQTSDEPPASVLSLSDAQKGLSQCIQFSEQLDCSEEEVRNMWKLMDWLNRIGHDSLL